MHGYKYPRLCRVYTRPELCMGLRLDYSMALVLDDNSDYVAHAFKENRYFRGKKILFVTALDLIECLEQIK